MGFISKKHESYMPIDFSIFEENYKAAVHCKTKEEASRFIAAMIAHYPTQSVGWIYENTRWHVYGEDTVYAPHIGGRNNGHLQCSPTWWWRNAGYTIIPFESLVKVRDLGEIILDNAISLDLLIN